MKIGIVGGTFDPIHVGHLLLGSFAWEQLGLDRIWFMPAGMPYFKEGKKVSSRKDRLAMTRLAVKGIEAADVCDIELKREGRTYTFETVEELNRTCPEDEFFFIFGADCLDQIRTWRFPERILSGCTLVAAARGKTAERKILEEKAETLMQQFGGKILVMDFPVIELSSTMIRERAAAGLSLRFLVPSNVEKYIIRRHLYRKEEEA